jgi:hypothetical protein
MLCTTTLSKSHRETEPAAQAARRIDDRRTATAGMLRIFLGALREGLAAHRRYEHLRSEGVHHDPAIRRALGISHPASASEDQRRCRPTGSPA